MGVQRRTVPAGHRYRPPLERQRLSHDRRTLRRKQGAHRRLHHRARAGSGLGSRVGSATGAGHDAADRSAPVLRRARRVSTMPDLPDIERIFRQEYGRAVAVLTRVFGSIDTAEEAVQEAFTTAVQRWPTDGLPPSPAGWIVTTARNRAIDRLRRESSREDRYAQAALLQAAQTPAE